MKDVFALLSNTTDGVFAVDRDGQIVFWNDAAATLLGYENHEVLGRFCFEVIAGRDASGTPVCQPHCRTRMRALRQELVPTHDMVVRTKAGREIWVSVSTLVMPFQLQDLIVSVHLFRDVSREEEFKQFIGQLLSTVAKLSIPPGSEPH